MSLPIFDIYTKTCKLVKKRDLAVKLRALGWRLLREGGSHEIWTNGSESEPVPRHREISELLAHKILKKARKYPGSME